MNYSAPYPGMTVSHASVGVRAEFIRKVYHLFFLSVLATIGVGWFASRPDVAPAMLALMPVFLIADFVCILVLAFARRTSGLNVALLYVFAAVQGAILGPVLTMLDRYAPGVPSLAATLTACTFGALSLYVLQTRKDFSYLGGMLFVGLIALVVAGIVMWFVHSSLMHTVYSLVGVLIFCGYTLYDTSNIMNRLGPDEAVAGAISLYLDLLNLFWFILNLLMELQRRD